MLNKISLPSQVTEKWKQYVATISVSFGAFCGGTLLSWSSSALVHILPQNNTYNDHDPSNTIPGFTINHQEEALIGAMLTVGAMLIAIPTGYLADKFGRKNVILFLSLPLMLNWILIIFASNVETLIAARFFAGIGLGGLCVAAPMYIGEIAEASYRGVFGSFFQMFLCCGILFTCIIGSFSSWLGLAIILGIMPIIFALCFAFMPETPVYLTKINNIEKAEIILRELRGINADIKTELEGIQKDIQEANSKNATMKDLLTNKGNLRAIISVVGVVAFQQLSGINALIFYTVPIFQTAGSTMSPDVAAIIINGVQFVAAYVSILIIEKAQRKFFLHLSSVGMMLCLTALGMYLHLKTLDLQVINYIGFVPITSVVLFMIFFAIGYGPAPWMLMSEIFSPEIKGVASGISVLTSWVFAFIVTLCFPLLKNTIGAHTTFYMFAGFMAIATIFVQIVVPETRGKTLVQIQEALNK